MRTDVKVGLIGIFAIVLLVVIYFVVQGSSKGNRTPANDAAKASSAVSSGGTSDSPTTKPAAEATSLTTDIPALATPPAPPVAPPTAAAATPADPAPLQLAQANTGDTSYRGGMIPPPSSPSSPTSSGGPSFSPPSSPSSPSGPSSPMYGGLGGGTPMIPSVTTPPAATRPSEITLEPTRGTSGTLSGTPARPLGTPNSSNSSFGGRPGSALSGAIGSNTPSSPTPGTPSRSTGSFGTGSSFGASPALGSSTGTTYTVQKGDMLTTIAKRYNVSVKAIEAANPGINVNHIKVNQKLNIPAGSATAGTGAPAATPAFGTTTLTPSTPSLSLGGTPTTRPSARGTATNGNGASRIAAKPGSTYTIKKGDSLASIAQAAYGNKSAWRRIYRANRGELSDANTIPVGTTIRLPE
jgi:LysM repeat protein